MSMKWKTIICAFIMTVVHGNAMADGLPVKLPSGDTHDYGIRNPCPFYLIHNIVGPSEDAKGLELNIGDTSLQGTIYTGPYPFEDGESDYDYARYRYSMPLIDGSGTLRIDKYLQDKYNANSWPGGQGDVGTMTIGYRLDLGVLGFYDSVLSFSADSGFKKALTILEGPFVTKVISNHPSNVVIAFETDETCPGKVEISGPYPLHSSDCPTRMQTSTFSGAATKRHEITVTGLIPNMEYNYRYGVVTRHILRSIHSKQRHMQEQAKSSLPSPVTAERA